MSLSLTPSSGSSFFPGFPRWSDIERDIDRDISRMHRMFSDAAQHIMPNKEGVHHRKPTLSYEENDQQLEVEIELPGVAKENVTIDLQVDSLAISAKRYKTIQLQSDTKILEEGEAQQNGADTDDINKDDTQPVTEPTLSVLYEASIPIGNKFDTDNISATMPGDGILTMIIPKKVEHATSSRMIEIADA